ncbi:histidine kinase [Mucilaginibacter sp. ZT4R22]|uniref:Histidine kinase n=2 Tax=Mucilaginibacter pankratovii TaxID=2772110 RepID=A0ABR7WJP3_9SPHI|nr:histidine kinase [Mucilaginibacter pankratovii]
MTMGLQLRIGLFKKLDYKLLLKHFAGWVIFIIYEVSFARFSIGAFAPLQNYICYYGLNVLLFYFNAHVVLPFAIKSGRSYLVIPVMMILELFIYLVLKYALDTVLAFSIDKIPSQTVYIKTLLLPNIYRGISFLGCSSLYLAILRVLMFRNRVHNTETIQLKTLKEKAELERNLAEAMNAYLQQQISPHLLFNTLTFIHNTYYKQSREASQCVLLLVDIMRFSLEEVSISGKTQLAKEVEQIQNFIELNQLRFDYELYIDFQVAGDMERAQIIPLILLTLTENIFKHGYMKKKEGEAKLHITINAQNELRFVSWNLKKHQPEKKRLRSIGIKNVIKRLDYSYQHHYKLNIRDEEDSFGVELMMQL